MLRLAATILFAVSLLAACTGDSGPEGSYHGDCRKYAEKQARDWRNSEDGLIPGVLTVGFIKDTKIAAAKRYLDTLGTSFEIPGPYREFAVICTDNGWEDHWEAILDADPIVEWAHREGITPLAGE